MRSPVWVHSKCREFFIIIISCILIFLWIEANITHVWNWVSALSSVSWCCGQSAYFCTSWRGVKDKVAPGVQRSGARCYTPDGGEVFTSFLSSSFKTNTHTHTNARSNSQRHERIHHTRAQDYAVFLILKGVEKSLVKCLYLVSLTFCACVTCTCVCTRQSGLRWCRRWVGCDSKLTHFAPLIWSTLMSDLTGDGHGAMQYIEWAHVHFALLLPCPLTHLEVTKHHVFFFFTAHFLRSKDYLSEYYCQDIHTEPIIHDSQSYSAAPEKWKHLKCKIMNCKSCCASVSLFSPLSFFSNEGEDSSCCQGNVSAMASVEWQWAKWAWPWRRGNSIMVCQSWGSKR